MVLMSRPLTAEAMNFSNLGGLPETREIKDALRSEKYLTCQPLRGSTRLECWERMTEHCCEELQEAVDNEAILHAPKQRMFGRILNEVDSDYAVRSPEERPSLYLINFCPFCGRAISRTVWNAEKKK
jgi:hypothetical protein